MDERWLTRQLSPYGIRPRNLRIEGIQAKGYCQEDMLESVRRYVPKADARALLDELRPAPEEAPPSQSVASWTPVVLYALWPPASPLRSAAKAPEDWRS